MSSRMTRRDALKLGTGTAITVAASPLLPSPITKSGDGPVNAAPASLDEICFMRAVDMVEAIRTKKTLCARSHASTFETD